MTRYFKITVEVEVYGKQAKGKGLMVLSNPKADLIALAKEAYSYDEVLETEMKILDLKLIEKPETKKLLEIVRKAPLIYASQDGFIVSLDGIY